MSSGDRQSYPLLALTSRQRDRFEAAAAREPASLQRRARVILLADQGLAVGAIAAETGLSKSGVRYWLRRYQAQGMDILGALAHGAAGPALAPAQEVAAESSAKEPSSDPLEPTALVEPGPGVLSLKTLCDWYSIDLAHGQYVAALAAQLFDATQPVHGLDLSSKRLLENAALVHNIAFEIDPARHHEVGRDILLRHPLEGFSADEQRMLALLTVFHRKKVRPDREPVFVALDRVRQREVLALAAILRLADSLDYSHSQSVTISDVRLNDERLMLVIEGRNADLNVSRTDKMADLWQQLFTIPVQVWERFPLAMIQTDLVRARLEPGLNLPEAGRLLMGHYLALVEQHAERLREGRPNSLPFLERDIGRLHGVIRAFERYFDAAALGSFKKDARWVTQQATHALTRQAIAILTRAETLPASASEQASAQLQEVIQARQKEASEALDSLVRALDGRRYRQFLTDLLEFSRRSGYGVFPGAHTDMQVGIQAAVMIWTEFNALRGERVPTLSIEDQWRLVVRFTYMLQFLGSVLGEPLDEVMSSVQPLEAQLRDIMLGDAVLASFRELLGAGEARKGKQAQVLAPTLERWIAVQEDWLREAHAQLEPLWAHLKGLAFRRQLALAVAQP